MPYLDLPQHGVRYFYTVNGPPLPPLTINKEGPEPVSGPLDPNLPNLVFIHISCSRLCAMSSQWSDQRLRKAFNLIVFDQVLHGRTTARERETFTLEDSAVCQLAGLDKLGIKKFSLVGAGFHGVNISAWLAIKAPERVQAMVLVAPGHFEERPGVAEELHSQWLPRVCKNKNGNGDGSGTIDEAEVEVITDFFFGKVYRDPEVRPVTRAVFQRRYGTGHTSPHDITHIVHFFFRKRISPNDLASITCPVLILHGGDDHVVSPKDAAEEWRDALTSAKGGAKLHVVTGAPHKLLLVDASVAK
ncbi:hypothetical protein RQP46_002660 [Phenoliferia psychrophenolica]